MVRTLAITLALAGCIESPEGDSATPDAAATGGAQGGSDAGEEGEGGRPVAATAQAELTVEPRALYVPAALGRATLTVTNTGRATAHLASLSLHGDARFTPLLRGVDPRRSTEVLDDPDADGAPGLEPGAHFTVEVEAGGDEPGPHAAVLVLAAEDLEVIEVPITDTAPGTCLAFDPPALLWQTPLGEEHDAVLTLRACGDGPTHVTALALAGESPEHFRLGPDTPVPPFDVEDTRNLSVLFTAAVEDLRSADLLITTSGDGQDIVHRVPLSGAARENQCPVALVGEGLYRGPPLEVILLDGNASYDPDGPNGRPVQYEWVVLERPAGSVAQPMEAQIPDDPTVGEADNPQTPSAVFFVDRAGRYTLELRVMDDEGRWSNTCEQQDGQYFIIDTTDEPSLEIRLTYEAVDPDAPPPDLDLHLRHPLAEPATPPVTHLDCYFGNPSPDWGILGDTTDDPVLFTDSPGLPEVIIFNEPENTEILGGPYHVFVHHYDGGPARARLTVFIDGEPAYTGPEMDLTLGDHDFADVLQIEWPARIVREDIFVIDDY